MRILKILDSHDAGGIFTCEYQFLKEMVRRGTTVDGIIVGDGDKRNIYSDILSNTHLINDNYQYRKLRNINSILFAKRNSKNLIEGIFNKVKKNNYIAIIYRRPAFLYLAGHLGKKINTNTFWFLPRSLDSAITNLFYQYALRRYNIIPIANSEYTKNTVGKICRHFVYPGFQEQRIGNAASGYREKLNISDDSPVYGIASRISYEKAHDLVIQAFKKSDIPSKNGHLVIAGGPLDTDYHKLLKEVSGDLLNSKIHFLGHIDDMASFYSSVDVVINGRRDAEPFGISIAEALASGTPVISYYLGGPSEMISNNYNGWLVENPTADSYLKMLNISIINRDKWQQMSINAEVSSENLSSARNVAKLLQILEKYNRA